MTDKVTMFTVEGAPHHYIPPASDWRLEAYLDGNSAPLKHYLSQRCYSLGLGTYTVHVDNEAVRDYLEQQQPLLEVSELVIDVPSYWYEDSSNVQ
jgi:hypothetical protein